MCLMSDPRVAPNDFRNPMMRAWPAENRVDIRGELKTWIGDSKPYSEIKSYVIQFSRVDGVSWLARFGEINNEKN